MDSDTDSGSDNESDNERGNESGNHWESDNGSGSESDDECSADFPLVLTVISVDQIQSRDKRKVHLIEK